MRDTDTDTDTAPRYQLILDACRELAAVMTRIDALQIGERTQGRMSSIKWQLQAPLDALREEAQAEYRRHTDA